MASPNGHVEFRLFIQRPEGRLYYHLAYQVMLGGKPVLDTSYLAVEIHDQEPLLGENLGLVTSKVSHDAIRYNSLIAEYLQNGSIGRRISLEVRVWDDGVAFRYVIPKTTPLAELLIEDEVTEFSFPAGGHGALAEKSALPFIVQQGAAGWVGIYEAGNGAYPKTELLRTDPGTMVTRLAVPPRIPKVAYEGVTPWAGPWRVVAVAATREGLAGTRVVRELVKEE